MKTILTDKELTAQFEMIGLSREAIINQYEDTDIYDKVVKAVEKMSDGDVESIALNAVEGLYDEFIENVRDIIEEYYIK